jgi:short-subunit dehydrogenase
MQKFEKKVVLITGASSGIGEASAVRLQKRGFIVYAAARRIDRMAKLKEKGINILKMDVTDDKSMKDGVDQIIKDQGKIHILVNNAGYGSYGALEDVPIAEAKYQFEVNIFGLARLIQLVLPYMRKNNYGKIVNISSIGGKIYEPLGSWYHATKFALEGLSDCLRLEVKNFGIDVIVVEPGGIRTEWGKIALDNLLKTSGNTDYKDLAQNGVNFFKAADKIGSVPDVIAKVIEKSIMAGKPKTRYAAGAGAGIILFLRKILSDKAFDWFMNFIIKRM